MLQTFAVNWKSCLSPHLDTHGFIWMSQSFSAQIVLLALPHACFSFVPTHWGNARSQYSRWSNSPKSYLEFWTIMNIVICHLFVLITLRGGSFSRNVAWGYEWNTGRTACKQEICWDPLNPEVWSQLKKQLLIQLFPALRRLNAAYWFIFISAQFLLDSAVTSLSNDFERLVGSRDDNCPLMMYDRSRGHSAPLPEMMFPPIVMTLIPIVMTFLSAVIMFAPTVITAAPAVTMFPAMMMTFWHGPIVTMTIPSPKHLFFSEYWWSIQSSAVWRLNFF